MALGVCCDFGDFMFPRANRPGSPRLAGDDSKQRQAIVTSDRSLEWEINVGPIHDAWVLQNGNILARTGWPDYIFHKGEEIGPKMLARIARKTALKPEDL
jgi:hypothetical protein